MQNARYFLFFLFLLLVKELYPQRSYKKYVNRYTVTVSVACGALLIGYLCCGNATKEQKGLDSTQQNQNVVVPGSTHKSENSELDGAAQECGDAAVKWLKDWMDRIGKREVDNQGDTPFHHMLRDDQWSNQDRLTALQRCQEDNFSYDDQYYLDHEAHNGPYRLRHFTQAERFYVNHKNCNGDTPLHVAIRNKEVSVAVIEQLLCLGARYGVDLRNKNKRTASDVGYLSSQYDSERLIFFEQMYRQVQSGKYGFGQSRRYSSMFDPEDFLKDSDMKKC